MKPITLLTLTKYDVNNTKKKGTNNTEGEEDSFEPVL